MKGEKTQEEGVWTSSKKVTISETWVKKSEKMGKTQAFEKEREGGR